MTPNKKIKLADIECVDNRKISGIEELAENIRAVGLLQPILIRAAEPNAVPPYVVVDGRRRFRALELLKREFIEPEEYVFFTGEDELTSVAAFSANFVRQSSLTWAEEVEQLSHLAGSQQEIAALLGKSANWVALRQNLANLTGKWREVLNHPEEYPQWTAAKLELIAREPAEMQNEFAEEWIDDDLTIAELKQEFADAHRLISAFPFGTAECMECAKRSGAQGLLFSDYDPKKDCCLDLKCFVRKAVAFVRQRLKEEPGIIYTVRGDDGWFYEDEDRALAGEFPNNYEYEYKVVRKPRKGEKPNAIVVCGDGIGEYRVVVPREGQFDEKSDKPEKTVASAGEKREKTVAEREADLLKKRNKLALQKLKEWLDSGNNTFETLTARGAKNEKQMHEICLKLAMWYGISTSHGAWGDYWYRPIWQDVKEFEAVVFKNASNGWRNILLAELNKTLENISMEAGQGICGLLFLDWEEFMKAAEAEIPEPKALIAARIKEQQQANKKAKAKK